jgi:hypothetical protein
MLSLLSNQIVPRDGDATERKTETSGTSCCPYRTQGIAKQKT